MRCRFGYLSGARCRLFAYGPADACAYPKSHHLLPRLNPDWFYLSATGLLRLSCKKRPLNGCSSLSLICFHISECRDVASCYQGRMVCLSVTLPRHTWSLMNCFRAGQGPCLANLHKWGLAQSPSCDCGQRHTTNHIVNTCPLTEIEGGLYVLHEADDDAVIWLESTVTAALTK